MSEDYRYLPSFLQPWGAWALRAYGAVTAEARLLPSVLIVGTQRGGTTSLFHTLRQHPAFSGPILRKGVHYFDVEYQRSFRWYRGHFPSRFVAAYRARPSGAIPIAGEASPYYMSHPLAGARISQDLPGVKIVALLRDPVERAYSAHAHELARGYETEDFATALGLEEQRLAGEEDRILSDPAYQSHSLRHHAYLRRGQYVDQLERLEQHVSRNRILVLDSSRFFGDPESEFGKLLNFLSLPPCSSLTYGHRNSRPRAPMARMLRRRLAEHFSPYDERLTRWLGEAPEWRTV